MTAPGVSVVVPTHNRPDLMRAAVQSVLAQRYDGDIEVLVVFDACEPALPTVDSKPGRSIRALVNERTRGLAGTRNTGLLAAQHGLVAFLDDDDEWLPHKLQRQIDRLESCRDSLLIGTEMTLATSRRAFHSTLPPNAVRYEQLTEHRLPALHASSFLLRRDRLLSEVGLLDEGFPRSYCEDWDLLLRVASVAPVAVVNEPLVRIRWQGQSLFVGQWADYAAALEQLRDSHGGFRSSRRAQGHIEGLISFAHASSGRRRDALRSAVEAIRRHPTQARPWVALAIAAGVISSGRVVRGLGLIGRRV